MHYLKQRRDWDNQRRNWELKFSLKLNKRLKQRFRNNLLFKYQIMELRRMTKQLNKSLNLFSSKHLPRYSNSNQRLLLRQRKKSKQMKRKKHNRKLLNKLKVLNNHKCLLKIRLRDHNKLQLLNKLSRCNSLGQDPLGQAVFDHQ